MFAWTVNPPITAAFLGAGYWASGVVEYLASRQHVWAAARVAVPAMWLFTLLTTIATLLHLDRFHIDLFIVRIATDNLAGWAWMAVYVLVPPILLVLWLRQLRMRGVDPPRLTRLPTQMRFVLSAQAVVLLAAGSALFLAPAEAAPFWPWMLTPLTARATAAWLIGWGALAAHSCRENDWARVQVAMPAYAVVGVLQLIVLARYPDAANWGDARAWLYLGFVLGIAAVGIFGVLGARSAAAQSRMEPVGAR